MNAAQVAGLLHAKRIGKGKYIAKCCAHPDRNPSLSIREGKTGVLIHCWSGCPKEAILAAIGLKFSDLFYDSGLTNRKDILAAKIVREKEEAARQAQKRELSRQIQAVCNWEAAAEKALPGMLQEGRSGDNAAKSFHYALEQARKLNEILRPIHKSFAEVEIWPLRSQSEFWK